MSRLKAIVEARGGILLDGGRRALIRGPDHGPADRSVSLIETEDGRILIHCFSPRDNWRAVRADLIGAGLLAGDGSASEISASRPAIVQPQSEDKTARARRIWEESRSIAGSAAERYLSARAISRVRAGALRFHPAMTSLEDATRRPALIAAITNPSAEISGVHVTLLSAHGATKAQLATPRRVIGRMLGSAVRLDDADDVLIVAEGVETALSAQTALAAPAWALVSAVNLARFSPPASLSRLVIAADNDAAGMSAAHNLQARVGAEIDVDIIPAPEGFNDWNDWAKAR